MALTIFEENLNLSEKFSSSRHLQKAGFPPFKKPFGLSFFTKLEEYGLMKMGCKNKFSGAIVSEKAVWYYKKEEEKIGPFTHDQLQKMLDQKKIEETTKIWTDNFKNWIPISEVEHFNLSSYDETPAVEIEKKVIYSRESDQVQAAPRPWIRFWARMIDYSLLSLLFILIFYSFNLSFFIKSAYSFILICFVWIFIESFLLWSIGTTPGKWLLAVTLRDEHLQKLKFSDAINRSFSVWWLGMGAGIFFFYVITMIVAAVKLSNTGKTSWDHRNHYVIMHGKIGIVRTLIAIIYFLCYFYFMSLLLSVI